MTIEIANKLIELRKNHGLSQEELAEKLGISRQAVSKWERAESSPDIDNIILLSRLYGIGVDELLCNENSVSIDGSELVLESAAEAEPEETVGSSDGVTNFECTARANLTIKGTEGGVCTVAIDGPEDEKRSCRVFTEGDTLSIIQDDDSGFWDRVFSSPKNLNITVGLPHRMDSIEAKLKGGSVNIERISANSMEFKLGGGRAAISDCSARELEVLTGGGSIIIRGVKTKTSEIKTGGGSVKAEELTASDRLEAKTGGGSIVISGSALETEAVSGGGDVRLSLSGAERVEAKTGGGGVSIELSGVKGVKAKLGTGGGRARLIFDGSEIMCGRRVEATVGDGSTTVEASSGGGSVTLSVN